MIQHDSVKDLFDQFAQTKDNHALPATCYTHTDFHNWEYEKLFQSEWHCLGRCDQIPNPGDFFTIDFVGEPLLAVRTEDREIKVMSNICRHRGMPIASGTGNKKKLRCPYHAWTYNLDGTLRNAPLVPAETLDKNCNLPTINSHFWQGYIFISLDSSAIWPADAMQPLEQAISNYHMDEMHHAVSFEETWSCNWKSLVENFMDAYHLSAVHPETLHPLTPTSLCRKLANSDAFTAYTAQYTETAPERMNYHPDVTNEQSRQSQLFCIFPSLVASVSADTLVYLALHPLGVDQVFVKWGIACYESDLSQNELSERVEKWTRINDEDHQILKRLHDGLHSRFSNSGPLAAENYEGTLGDFHRYLKRMLR